MVSHRRLSLGATLALGSVRFLAGGLFVTAALGLIGLGSGGWGGGLWLRVGVRLGHGVSPERREFRYATARILVRGSVANCKAHAKESCDSAAMRRQAERGRAWTGRTIRQ